MPLWLSSGEVMNRVFLELFLEAPRVASLSASSLPVMLECPLTHLKDVLPVLLQRVLIMG